MADIKIIIDTTDLVDAKKKLASFQKQMGDNNSILGLTRGLKSVESNVRELVAAQKKGQLSSDSFKQGLLEQKRALVQLGVSSQKASTTVQALAKDLKNQEAAKAAVAATRDLARAQKESADAHERTRQRYVAGAAAQAQLKQAQRDLSAAYRAGVIHIDEYRQALILLNQQNLGNRRSTNNLGVAMQQTGYQVGDFVVQVQSGQNPMVAFGQQATQLVGVLYLLPPATLAARVGVFGLQVSVSALIMTLGIAIPILTAIGAAYMRMKKDSDVAGKASDSLDEKLKALSSTLEDYANTLDAMKAGVSLDELFATRGIKDAVKDLADAQAQFDTLAASKPKQANLSGMGLASAPTYDLSQLRAYFFGTEELTNATNEVIAAKTRLQLLLQKEADTRASNFAERSLALTQELALLQAQEKYGVDSAQAVNAELAQELRIRLAGIDARVTSGELDKNAGEALKLQVERAALLGVQIRANTSAEERRVAAIKLFFEYAQRNAALIAERNAAVKAIVDGVDAEKKSLQDQIDLNQTILQFGKDSAQVKAKEAEIAREQYRLQQMSADIHGNNLKVVMDTYDEYVKSNTQLEASEESAKGLADALKEAASAMSSLSSFGDSLDKALAVSLAKVQALKSGADAAIAGSIAGMRADLSSRVQEGLASGVPIATLMSEFDSSSATISQIEASEKERKRLEAEKREISKGSKSSSNVVNINEIIAARKEQIAQDRVLLGLSGQQQDAQKVYYDLLKQNEKADIKLTQTELMGAAQAIAAQEEQNRVIEENRKQQEDLADFVANSMGDALMSIVDGTMSVKDAFKSMASDIIKELYRVLVVQQLVGSFDSKAGTGSGIVGAIMGASQADGGAWQGGSQIQAYANGGVVGGPTMFPMAGGKTGLMGEAGPEAIMPLKRGKNGKLGVQIEGGGGNTTVVQNFNFSANGDDSVKKIIAQAAPQIANMTKKSIMDDRRRGGQMKATFG